MAQETLHYSHSEKDFILSPHSKKAPKRMASLMELKEIFRSADAVCFDVDSTVIREEGIDELAKFCGVGDAVAEMYVWLGQLPVPAEISHAWQQSGGRNLAFTVSWLCSRVLQFIWGLGQ